MLQPHHAFHVVHEHLVLGQFGSCSFKLETCAQACVTSSDETSVVSGIFGFVTSWGSTNNLAIPVCQLPMGHQDSSFKTSQSAEREDS